MPHEGPHEGPHERKRPTDEGPAYGVCIHMSPNIMHSIALIITMITFVKHFVKGELHSKTIFWGMKLDIKTNFSSSSVFKLGPPVKRKKPSN